MGIKVVYTYCEECGKEITRKGMRTCPNCGTLLSYPQGNNADSDGSSSDTDSKTNTNKQSVKTKESSSAQKRQPAPPQKENVEIKDMEEYEEVVNPDEIGLDWGDADIDLSDEISGEENDEFPEQDYDDFDIDFGEDDEDEKGSQQNEQSTEQDNESDDEYGDDVEDPADDAETGDEDLDFDDTIDEDGSNNDDINTDNSNADTDDWDDWDDDIQSESSDYGESEYDQQEDEEDDEDSPLNSEESTNPTVNNKSIAESNSKKLKAALLNNNKKADAQNSFIKAASTGKPISEKNKNTVSSEPATDTEIKSEISSNKQHDEGKELSAHTDNDLLKLYDPNYDGYYDDTEVIYNDVILKVPKDIILKAIFMTIAIGVSIIYFIYNL